MTVTNKELLVLSVTAAEDLSAQSTRYKAITLAGVVVPTATAAGASARVIGINLTSAKSGEQASALVSGITKAVAGVAISTLGFPVFPGSLGFMFAAASGNNHCGRALETCASGDLFKVAVDFTALVPWNGA